VKLIGLSGEHYEFELSNREKELLLQLLGLYPRIPAGYQSSALAKDIEEANQRLLAEALEETRSENQKRLQSWIANRQKLSPVHKAWRLKLSASEVDWLLELLNDVRVGSWIRLGSPEVPQAALTDETAPDFWTLEMAGYFQAAFLELLEGNG